MHVCARRVAILNDFEAVGYGVPVLTDNDLVVLNDVPAEDKARNQPAPIEPATAAAAAAALAADDRSCRGPPRCAAANCC